MVIISGSFQVKDGEKKGKLQHESIILIYKKKGCPYETTF